MWVYLAIASVGSLALVLLIRPLRRVLLSNRAYAFFMHQRPTLSETEQAAIDAGTVGVEAELFRGQVDWKQWLSSPSCQLTDEEQAFIDGPVTALCRRINDWEITHDLKDLPEDVWQCLKSEGFFGMVIPKAYGGLGFSQWAHAVVIVKLAAYSISVATTVSVPNSIGPAELLLAYGTEAQKKHYLPRLATGLEMPCFALTGPWAGSDATSMVDTGIVCHGSWQGEEVLGIRLQWEKRYITLAPIATLIGLAFKCYDPDQLLGDQYDLGITVALVPRDTQGVCTGQRHVPLDSAFLNGPIHGKDVFIPMTQVIGGKAQLGQGWRMLMESLATGRAITLPSMALGSAGMAVMDTVSYVQIREQFRRPIAAFDGVALLCGQMVGRLYQIQAVHHGTIASLMQGAKPSLASAISKYHGTELARKIINDAMDVQGGRGICLGPLNTIGRIYQQTPISITVEGANVLTRNLIIFGQGAVRCHPFVLDELKCAQLKDEKQAKVTFDRLLWRHLGYVCYQMLRAVGLSVAKAVWVPAKVLPGPLRKHLRMATRLGVGLACCADLMMLCMGQKLKRAEHLSARLGDVLSALYLTACVLQYHHQLQCPPEDEALVDVCCQDLLYQAQSALDALMEHVPTGLSWVFKVLLFPWGRPIKAVKDTAWLAANQGLVKSKGTRERLFAHLLDAESSHPALRAYQALEKIAVSSPVEKKWAQCMKGQAQSHLCYEDKIAFGLSEGMITQEEADQLKAARLLRHSIIAVDDFHPDEL